MLEGHFQCVHMIRFSQPTKIGSLKTDRVNWSEYFHLNRALVAVHTVTDQFLRRSVLLSGMV